MYSSPLIYVDTVNPLTSHMASKDAFNLKGVNLQLPSTRRCCKRRISHMGSKSSIGTSRFPKYQKIQNTRLRKMMSGPEKTRKSQKLRGAKTPTKKRRRPATSRMKAIKKKNRQRPMWAKTSMTGAGNPRRTVLPPPCRLQSAAKRQSHSCGDLSVTGEMFPRPAMQRDVWRRTRAHA